MFEKRLYKLRLIDGRVCLYSASGPHEALNEWIWSKEYDGTQVVAIHELSPREAINQLIPVTMVSE